MESKDWFLLFAGALIGGILGLGFSYLFTCFQFNRGNGKHRLNVVVEATRQFRKPNANISAIRDRYRYGLAVIIDDLRALDEHGFKNYGRKVCPTLVDCPYNERGEYVGADRWGRFNLYVRPVMDDIDSYSFLRSFASTTTLRQIGALTDLCIQIEVVVMHLDAAFEVPKIAEWQNEAGTQNYELVIIDKVNDSDAHERVEGVMRELKKLKDLWDAWERLV